MTYLIKLEVDPENKILVYTGNMQGEVYIYQVMNVMEAFQIEDAESSLPKAELMLLDMILTGDPYSVRQMTQVGE